MKPNTKKQMSENMPQGLNLVGPALFDGSVMRAAGTVCKCSLGAA